MRHTFSNAAIISASPKSNGGGSSGGWFRSKVDREGGAAWKYDSAFTLTQRTRFLPINTLLSDSAWSMYQAIKAEKGFRARTVDVSLATNGPIVQSGWSTTYGLPTRPAEPPLSVHFNCNTKSLLRKDHNATSWLFHA